MGLVDNLWKSGTIILLDLVKYQPKASISRDFAG